MIRLGRYTLANLRRLVARRKAEREALPKYGYRPPKPEGEGRWPKKEPVAFPFNHIQERFPNFADSMARILQKIPPRRRQ